MECSPGGRFLISMLILTPLAAGVRVAVPTLWPCAFLMSTVTVFAAAWARLSCTKTRLAADKNLRVLRMIEARKILFQIFQFGKVVVDDVRIVGIILEVILMVVLGGIESLEGLDLRDDRPGVDLCSVELRDVGLRDALLLRAAVEDRGAVLGASVRTLAIPLRGIVRDREKNHQELAVGELRRIVGDADRFGVAGDAHAHTFVGR